MDFSIRIILMYFLEDRVKCLIDDIVGHDLKMIINVLMTVFYFTLLYYSVAFYCN